MAKVVIVIPVYKKYIDLNALELHALKQVSNVLGQYPFSFVVPENFLVEEYLEIFKRSDIQIKRFNTKYFDSVKSYNKLCLSKEFYRAFCNYDYMLLFQTDAYVFRNELEMWVQSGYDFIGAPFHENNDLPFDETTWSVGNGGFSLRSIKKCKKIAEKLSVYRIVLSMLNILFIKRFLIKLFQKINIEKFAVIDKVVMNKLNEDCVFGKFSNHFIRGFKVAPLTAAIKFSFESHPSLLFQINHEQLPFGCHAWDKYEPEFWLKFIHLPKQNNYI